MKAGSGRQALDALIARADVFVCNLAPAAVRRLGLEPGRLAGRHPRLVACQLSGYGEDGPYAERKAYGSAKRVHEVVDHPQLRSRWNLAAPAAGRFVLVFEQDGRVDGFVSGGQSRDQFPGGEVYAIYVDPACQGRGAGGRLLTAAARHLAEAHFTDACLWGLAGNHPARRFYESQGWRSDGTEQPWTHPGGSAVMEVRYVAKLPVPG